jgi:hypothetical protein
MKKILNVILPIALLAVVYGFIREMYFVQQVYQEEYATRFSLFSGLLTLAFIFLVLLIGYGYSKTDRVRILDGIFGILPAIVLLVPVVCYFLGVVVSSVGGWINNFLNWTTLSIGGVPMSSVIADHWQTFALAGLALLLAVIFRKKRVKEEDDEEDEDYLDDLPPVGESQKPAAKPEPADAVEVKPVEAEVIEPDPIYAEPEPAAPEAPEVIEMPAPEAPAAPETPAE